MARPGALSAGRAAYGERRWSEVYEHLTRADAVQPLEPDDLEQLANAARVIGQDTALGPMFTRAHQGYVERGDVRGAARCAFRLALMHLLRGERGQGGGWTARAVRMLDDAGQECAERGYLSFTRGLHAVMGGELPAALEAFSEAVEIGARCGDPSLVAFARHGVGRTLVGMGEVRAGMALFDEVMAAISAGEVSPLLVGDIYCSIIESCREVLDVRRAQEWTAALHEWCATQPDLMPYRGQCLVHRAEVLTLQGQWPSAVEEAERARAALSDPPPPRRAVSAALYQLGELHRLRGEFDEAEAAFRDASRAGRDPQPGLALLRAAGGQVQSARTMLARAMEDPGLRTKRPGILFACVEVALAAGDVTGARTAADALARLVTDAAAPWLCAMAAHALGAVLLAEDDGHGALDALRRAASLWEELGAPYESARTRALVGVACRMLGDVESAELELDGAHRELLALGARPDAERVAALGAARNASARSEVLTGREVEVLRLVASGRTNRAIASSLGLSEKTVARHVANIFAKLDLSSRAAATAYAYEHGLVTPRA